MRRDLRIKPAHITLIALAVLVSAVWLIGVSDAGAAATQEAKLTASDAKRFSLFGYSVAVSGDTAVVGARDAPGGFPYSGSAYIFVRGGGTWSQQAKLKPSDLLAFASFGRSVAVSGDTAVVGAAGDSDGGLGSGSAYLYTLASPECSPGTFNLDTGTEPCVDAPAGSYIDTAGATQATDCPLGRYNPDTGSTSSAAGVAAPAGHFVGVTGSAAATPCPLGEFNSLTGQFQCVDAAAGSYVDTVGATQAIPCPPFKFTLDSGSTSVDDCLPDTDGDGVPDLIDPDDDNDGSSDGADCNRIDASIYPGAPELAYDGIDQDCDGLDLTDVDGDGQDSDQVIGGRDCDDDDPSIHFGALEIINDGIDQDCDGEDLTTRRALQAVTNVLHEIVDDDRKSEIADKLEDAISKQHDALAELGKAPPDNQAALGNIEGAVGEIEAAVGSGLLDANVGDQQMDQLAMVARSIAAEALRKTIDQGADADVIDDAQDALDEGDELKDGGAYKDAVGKYKDALSKAESEL